MITTAALHAMLAQTRDPYFTRPDRIGLERARLATERCWRFDGEPPPLLRKARNEPVTFCHQSLDRKPSGWVTSRKVIRNQWC